MPRALLVLVLTLLAGAVLPGVAPLRAQQPSPTRPPQATPLPEARDVPKTKPKETKDKPPKAVPVATAVPAEVAPPGEAVAAAVPAEPTGPASTVKWYGHSFVYITSSQGVRVALDPFGEQTVTYKFPERLPADVALITCLAEDHEGAVRLLLVGSAFRATMGVGPNNSNGLIFKGIQTYRDKARSSTNTVYSFTMDGVRFCHLGMIGHIPDSRQRQEIGPVDVLFLPVGQPKLSIAELNGIAKDLKPKIIVPINYRTKYTGDLNLRSLEEYFSTTPPFEVKQMTSPTFAVSPKNLPANPTIWVLPLPPQV